MIIALAAFLIIASLLFGAVATDQFLKPEFMYPDEDRVDQVIRGVFGFCAIAAAFAAGLVL